MNELATTAYLWRTTSRGSYFLIRVAKRQNSRRHLLCEKWRHDPSK